MVGRYIVIPCPAAADITNDGIHRTAPAPQHRAGVIALGNIVGVHQPCTLTGIITYHILLNPGGRRDHTKVVAGGLKHIVAVLDGKVHIGVALCPTQGFCTLVGSGIGYCHCACIEVQAVPGIAIMELIQVNTDIHIGRGIKVCPVTAPLAAVGIVGIVVRCSLGIDSKDQVGVTFIPQSLHIVSLQAGINRNNQGVTANSAAGRPVISSQQFVYCGHYLGFHGNHQIAGDIFYRIGSIFADDFLTIYLYGSSNAVVGHYSKAVIRTFQSGIRTAEGITLTGGSSNAVVNRLNRLDLYQQISKAGSICHHGEGFTSIKGSQIDLKGVRAIYKLIGTDTNFTVAPIIVAVPNHSTAQIASQGDLQGGIAGSDQILGGGKAQLIVTFGTPTDGLCVHIGNSQSAVVAVAVRNPVQQLKAGCAGLIHVEAECGMVIRHIVVPSPAAVYITDNGIHRTAPAPQHGTGVATLRDIVRIHQPGTLTGIILHHILLNPGGRRSYAIVVAPSLQHIVAILNSKVTVGAALCPVQGFCTLVGSGIGYSHSACIEAYVVPGIAIMELIQVNTDIHIGRGIKVCPVTAPLAAVGIVGIVVRCSLGIDSKDQVGVALIPQCLQIICLQAGICGNGKRAVADLGTIAPAVCRQQLLHQLDGFAIGYKILLSSDAVQIHCLQQAEEFIFGGAFCQHSVEIGIDTVIAHFKNLLFAV